VGTACAGAMKGVRGALLAGVAAIACVAAFVPVGPDSARAQQLDFNLQASPDAEMLLEADTLVYDNDRNTISAVGGVQIDYDGIRLVADRVTYDRNTSRLVASGRVEIVDREGNRFFSNEIDITDDFRDGFIQALRVETADDTYFAAESADRRDGEVTTFHRGVYTACRPCEDRPDRPPIWRVGSRKIIWNGRTRMVRFEGARFEFFGMPIAFLPFLEIPDPTVRQKSGFLSPNITFASKSRHGFHHPLLFRPFADIRPHRRRNLLHQAGLSRPGRVAPALRERWLQSAHCRHLAARSGGIRKPATRVSASVTQRAMISSRGQFQINPRWAFGWDVMAQTDKNFARTYRIAENSDAVRRSEIYLTGLNDRNFFDLRGYHFQVQESALDRLFDGRLNPGTRNPRQPWVLPSFDYHFTPEEPVAGGEVNLTLNAQNLHRTCPRR
jgi:LPS-assembly protein